MSLHRRHFLYLGGTGILAGALAAPSYAAEPKPAASPQPGAKPAAPKPAAPAAKPAFELAPLPYAYEALEPHIDKMTMTIHHDRHHAAYVKNLNAAVDKTPELKGKSLEDMLRSLEKVPESVRAAVRNNGGGHYNHTLFWQIMGPSAGGTPTGALAEEITKTFGSFDKFKEQFVDAGMKRFGSGWVWLVRSRKGTLEILSTPNQDNPLMQSAFAIMGNDLWEHAYYLLYQNKRLDYLNAWWNVVNWSAVEKRYQMALKA
jgi:superoxide dismutase, Fe-Mn family